MSRVFLFIIVIGAAIGFYFYQNAPVPPPPTPPAMSPPIVPAPAAPPPAAPPPVVPTPSPPPAAIVQPPPPSPPPPAKASPPPVPQPAKEKKPPEKLPAAKTATKEGEEKTKERPHILKVIATETTWLRMKPDDQPVIDVLLQPKETVSWPARGKFDIIVGNAGGIEIFFDGVSLGVLGKSGDVVKLVLPKGVKPAESVPPNEPKPSE